MEILAALIGAFATVFAVLYGFKLTAKHAANEDQEKHKRARRAILDELRANLHSLPQKRHSMERALEQLEQGYIPLGEPVRFFRIIYEAMLKDAVPSLSHTELNSLHLLHEHFRSIDNFLSTYNLDLAGSNGTTEALSLAEVAKKRLVKRLEHLRLIEHVLEHHVAGDPLDVLNVSHSYEEVRDANYKMPSDNLAEFLLETQPARRLNKGPGAVRSGSNDQ